MPTAKTALAMAMPRRSHVVDGTPAETMMYDEKVMALLAETSVVNGMRLGMLECRGVYSQENVRRKIQKKT